MSKRNHGKIEDIHGNEIIVGGKKEYNFTLSDDANMEWDKSQKGYTGGLTFHATGKVTSPMDCTWNLRVKTNCNNYDKTIQVVSGEEADFTVKTNGLDDTKVTIYVYGTDSTTQSGMSGTLDITY